MNSSFHQFPPVSTSFKPSPPHLTPGIIGIGFHGIDSVEFFPLSEDIHFPLPPPPPGIVVIFWKAVLTGFDRNILETRSNWNQLKGKPIAVVDAINANRNCPRHVTTDSCDANQHRIVANAPRRNCHGRVKIELTRRAIQAAETGEKKTKIQSSFQSMGLICKWALICK